MFSYNSFFSLLKNMALRQSATYSVAYSLLLTLLVMERITAKTSCR